MSVSSTPPFKITIPEKSNAIPLEDINTQLRAEEVNEIGEAINKNALFCGAGYADLSALQTAVPSPAIGSYAYLSSGVKYRCISLGVWSVEPTGNGDMTKAVYDPTNVNGDAFDMDNMVEGSTNKILTQAERDAIAGIGNPTKLKGEWDASSGAFPGGGTAQSGESWIVAVDGTVDGVLFKANDRIIAITDNASTSTFASNWFKADYTDVYQTDAEIETAYNNQVGQVSAGEKTAGTETAVRRFSPKDVADMVLAHESAGSSSIVDITPSDNPQVVFDSTPEGSLIRFLPGLHEHGINNNSRTQNAILYVDKAMDIEIMSGATIKLQDNEILLETEGEITTNHGVEKNLDDLEIGPTSAFTGSAKIDYYIQIDGTGSPNTFEWGVFNVDNSYTIRATGVSITGSEQTLEDGVKIIFGSTTGHNMDSIWYISYDGQEHYGIRVGEGFHANYIGDVNIFGLGTIDLNRDNNVQPGLLVANTSSCLLIHGRVRRCVTRDITMKNGHRTFMAYGDHNGTYYYDGSVSGGERFDAEYIDVLNTKNYNYAEGDGGIEFGHPSHRGQIKYVRCNDNYIEAENTPIEPNYGLREYEILNNTIKGTSNAGYAIHCWRRSDNGLIRGNVLIDGDGTETMVVLNAPGGWELPKNITHYDNHNLNSGAVTPYPPFDLGSDSPTDGLLAYYPLATDSNENEGTTSGIDGTDTDITYASGEAQFNGTSSYISIPHNDIFSFTDGVTDLPFTITFRVKFNDTSTAYFVNKGTVDANDREWEIAFVSSLLHGTILSSTTDWIRSKEDPWTKSTGTWYDIALTFDGNSVRKLYIDGVYVGANESNGTYSGMTNNGENIIIGKTGWTSAHFLNGSMKDLRFYSEYKSPAGIAAINAL